MGSDARTREQQRCRVHNLTPTDDVDPRVRVRLLTDGREEPIRISIRFPPQHYPARLVADLADSGWHNPHLDDLEWHPAANPHQPPHPWDDPLPYATGEISLAFTDSDPQSWQSRSTRAHRVEIARCVLRRYGITRSAVIEQTWRDII